MFKKRTSVDGRGTVAIFLTMAYRAFVVCLTVQSVLVAASPTAGLQHGDAITSSVIGTHYRPKSTTKNGLIPEVGKLPRAPALSKRLPVTVRPTYRFTPSAAIKNHPTRNSRLSAKETYQPLIPRIGHNPLEESYQKQQPQLSKEEKAEKVNSDLEKIIQFMTVLGQVDRYLSSKAKSFVSTLGRAMEGSPDDHSFYDENNKITANFDYSI